VRYNPSMKKLTTSILLMSLTLSSSFAETGEDCRLLMRGYDTLIGNSMELQKSVEKTLKKKGIQLIQESDLREGDYTNDIAKRFEDYRGLPIHKYLMTEKNKIIFVPCNGFPLCSPVIVDSEVKSIDGIKYNDSFRIKLVTAAGESPVLEKKFKHIYRGPLMMDHKDPAYFGSAEQIDLVVAIAKKFPNCKTLEKR
jgi:hypothetical protein